MTARHLKLSRLSGAAENVVKYTLCDGFNLPDAKEIISKNRGVTLLRAWETLDRLAISSTKPKDVYFYHWIPLFSSKLYHSLIRAGCSDRDFVEVGIAPWVNRRFYAHVGDVIVDALDAKRSKFMIWLTPDVPSNLQKACFNDRVPVSACLFRVPYPGLSGDVLPELFATSELISKLDVDSRNAVGV
jgi:hypothetical protein